MPSNARPLTSDTLAHIPEVRFIAAWCTIVGEPPALLLSSWSEMIRILVESTPVASACIEAASYRASREHAGRNSK